jgi:hypothetical protein
MLAAKCELTFKNVYEFRAFMGMNRKSGAGLKSNDLHFQAIGNGNILDKHSSEKIRWLPR